MKIYNLEAFKNYYESQNKNLNWNFYNERDFIENLLQTRFNFLITTYALILNAFFLPEMSCLLKGIVLCIGFIIITLMGLTVIRIRLRAKLIVEIMDKFDNNQIVKIFDDEIAKHKFMRKIKANGIIGVFIPIFLVMSLISLGILLLLGLV